MTSFQRGDSVASEPVHPVPSTPSPARRPRCFALVPCAGFGTRAGAAGPKQYEALAGRALVLWTLEALAQVDELSATLVVLSPGDTQFAALSREGDAEAAGACWSARIGGDTRADTVAAGLAELLARGAHAADWVLVHDAARCLVRPESVRRLITACRDDPVGGLLALPVADTLKRASPGAASGRDASGGEHQRDDRVAETVPRQAMWAAQTPQMFRIGQLAEALRGAAARSDVALTDDASAIEALGHSPRLVHGDPDNFKVTWPADFTLAESLLRSRRSHPTKVRP